MPASLCPCVPVVLFPLLSLFSLRTFRWAFLLSALLVHCCLWWLAWLPSGCLCTWPMSMSWQRKWSTCWESHMIAERNCMRAWIENESQSEMYSGNRLKSKKDVNWCRDLNDYICMGPTNGLYIAEVVVYVWHHNQQKAIGRLEVHLNHADPQTRSGFRLNFRHSRQGSHGWKCASHKLQHWAVPVRPKQLALKIKCRNLGESELYL